MNRILFALGVCVACGENTHVYVGNAYIEGRDCIGTQSSLDVVEGDPAESSCPPTCLIQRTTPDRVTKAFVSTMCPPYPYGFDTDGGDPRCPLALAALARGDICLVDGGSSAPSPRDAGAD